MVYLDNMYPSKSMFDYMSEIQRLFPRNQENDTQQDINLRQSIYTPPYQQSYANQSSSSAESISPESYFERRFERRPIVGRRLHVTPPQETEMSTSPIRWNIPEEFSTPKRNEYGTYELFPQRKEQYPINRTPTSSYSPPRSFLQPSPPIYRMHRPVIEKNFGGFSDQGPMICTFCRKNGEMPSVYLGHTVRRRVGNKSVVTCSILRNHVCGACGATGDDAHTISYCPELRKSNNGVPLQSTTITLKNTRVKSNGRRRY